MSRMKAKLVLLVDWVFVAAVCLGLFALLCGYVVEDFH